MRSAGQRSNSRLLPRKKRSLPHRHPPPYNHTAAEVLAHTQEVAKVGNWEYDPAGKTFHWSAHLYRMLGLEPSSDPVSLETACRLFHADDRARVWSDVESLIETGDPLENEVRLQAASGEIRTFFSRAIPVVDSAGKVILIRGISQDVTEQRAAEEKLRKSEALLAQAEEIADLGSWELNVDGTATIWSENLHRILKTAPQQHPIPLDNLWKRAHPEHIERSQRDLTLAMTQGVAFEHEVPYPLPDGEVRTLLVRGVPIRDADGKVARVIGVSRDVTKQREAEERLRKSEALLAQAETLANLGSWELDLQTGEVNWSTQISRMLGFHPHQASPPLEVFSQLIPLADREKILREKRRGPGARVPVQHEAHWQLPDGTTKILFTRALPVYSESGEPLRLIGTTEDITERRNREIELRRLSQQLLNVRDEEQRRVARDLHESVVQTMAAVKMLLGRVGDAKQESTARAGELIQSASELADETISQVRTISHLLHPPLLDEAGLYPALRWYARGFAERSSIATRVEMDEDFGRLPQETELAVFRIVQEALTNIHRHSGSADAIIRIHRDSANVRVEIEDHGRGMAPPSLAIAPAEVRLGVGTAGMRERVMQLDGKFEIKSEIGKGTKVCAVLPLAAPRRELDDDFQGA